MKPEIVITARGHADTMATLQAEFTAHLLHEAPDKNAFFKQHAPEQHWVADISFRNRSPLHSPAMSGAEVIQDNRFIAALRQCLGRMTADVTCSSS